MCIKPLPTVDGEYSVSSSSLLLSICLRLKFDFFNSL